MTIRKDLTITQGETYSTSLPIKNANNNPVNLTGYTGASQLRRHPSALTAYNFSVTTSGNTGIVTLSLSTQDSAAIPDGRYVYDTKITDSLGKVTVVYNGIVDIIARVTR